MERTLELADEIAEAISESEVYKSYIKAKNDVLKDPELYDKMKRFKKEHINFSNRRAEGNDISLYDEINVSRMYFELLNYNSTKQYLKNEQLLVELLSQVYEHLSQSCVEIFTGFEE